MNVKLFKLYFVFLFLILFALVEKYLKLSGNRIRIRLKSGMYLNR